MRLVVVFLFFIFSCGHQVDDKSKTFLKKNFEQQLFKSDRDSIYLDLQIPYLSPDFYEKNTAKYILINCISENCVMTLSSEIGSLKELKSLTFSKTSLRVLPKEIGNLENLEVLRIIGGGQLETLPQEIGELVNLKRLNLWRNKIKYLPKSIAKLTKLEVLNLGQNNISDVEIKEIKRYLPNCDIQFGNIGLNLDK